MKTDKMVCVYCGSSDRIDRIYHDAAESMGIAIADRGYSIVYGGGGTGLMGSVADAALSHGAAVIGVIPEAFNTSALNHSNLTELRVVKSMHERKALMADMADAFIALPGGFGTFDELFEILTWAQVGIHRHPIGILNTEGYYDPFLTLIKHAQEEGFIYNEHRDLLVHDQDPTNLLDRLMHYVPPEKLDRWVNREEKK